MTQRAVPVGIAAAAAVLAALLTGLVSFSLASPAQAAAYRYWTYWTGTSGSWTFGSAGPAFTLPQDGDVEGWSFRVSTTDGTADAAPSTPPAFDSLCGDIPPEDGLKRVGLVIDPGPAAIAPDGETPISPVATCVVMAGDATGYDVLRSVVEVRTDAGLVCALGGYPARECAPVLDDATVAELTTVAEPVNVEHGNSAEASDDTSVVAADESGSTDSGPTATLVVVGVVAAGAAALVLWRRRRDRSHA